MNQTSQTQKRPERKAKQISERKGITDSVLNFLSIHLK